MLVTEQKDNNIHLQSLKVKIYIVMIKWLICKQIIELFKVQRG